MGFYHEAMRDLQDRYEGRTVADRLEEHRVRSQFNEDDRRLIESAPFFFLATAGGNTVDCSFKGGEPGFVRIASPTELIWPDYDGNRMYRSLGNISSGTRVGLLFLQFDGQKFDGSAARLRVNGRAQIDNTAEAISSMPGAKRLIRLDLEYVFPNCPRYIPTMELQKMSIHSPREGVRPPDPEWKSKPHVKDIFEAEIKDSS
jgi:uncharacterized protein